MTILISIFGRVYSAPLAMSPHKSFVTLGMFIIDEFSFADENGVPTGFIMSSKERITLPLFQYLLGS